MDALAVFVFVLHEAMAATTDSKAIVAPRSSPQPVTCLMDDSQSWGGILALYRNAATTPLKRWLYKRAPK